ENHALRRSRPVVDVDGSCGRRCGNWWRDSRPLAGFPGAKIMLELFDRLRGTDVASNNKLNVWRAVVVLIEALYIAPSDRRDLALARAARVRMAGAVQLGIQNAVGKILRVVLLPLQLRDSVCSCSLDGCFRKRRCPQ